MRPVIVANLGGPRNSQETCAAGTSKGRRVIGHGATQPTWTQAQALESILSVMESQSLEMCLLQHVGVSLKKVRKIYTNCYQKIFLGHGITGHFHFSKPYPVVFEYLIVSIY